MRYAYAITTAILLTGSAVALSSGESLVAQVVQSDSPQLRTAPPRAGAPMSFADLTEQLQPAVVNISTKQKVKVQQRRNPFAGTPFGNLFGGNRGGGRQQPQTREAQSLGSGFVISTDGYIVTNNHVVAPGNRNATVESITVIMPDRTEYDAKLIGRDAASDLAVLKIKPKKDLPFVKFGDSSKSRVGDWIIAIGNPFGLGGTVTSGIISAVHRNTGAGGAYDNYLQTDASINSGNSGGPMFDMNGNVIGINNAIFTPTGGNVGIGFAIPSEVAIPIIKTLRKGEKVERGYLGVRIAPLTEDLAESLGLPKNRGEFIQSVEPDEGAAKAGIKEGDVIVKVNNKEVTLDQTLSFLVANLPVGSKVPIELIRDGKTIKVTATLGERPGEDELAQSFNGDAKDDFSDQTEQDNERAAQDAIGVDATPLTPQIARQVGVSENIKGLIIKAVDPSGDAARKGLRRRDIILSVNRRPTTTNAQLSSAISAAKRANRTAVLVQVQRGNGRAQFIAVKLKEEE